MLDGQGGAEPPHGRAPGTAAGPVQDLQAIARDWITIWQSEFAAMATDREAQEAWLRWIALWADAADTAARLLPGACPDPRGAAGATSSAGAASPMAAFDARDAALDRLAKRVEELERLIAERAVPGPGGTASGT